MICDQRVLIVLEDLLTHCRMNDFFWAKLLMVIRNLNRVKTWIIDWDVSNSKSFWPCDIGIIVISSKADYYTTDTRLL